MHLSLASVCTFKLIVMSQRWYESNISSAECEDKTGKIVVRILHDNNVAVLCMMDAILTKQQFVHYHLPTRAVAH